MNIIDPFQKQTTTLLDIFINNTKKRKNKKWFCFIKNLKKKRKIYDSSRESLLNRVIN